MRKTEYTLRLPGAPALTIALAADLHCRAPENVPALLRETKPDLIVSTGDMLHHTDLHRADTPFNRAGLDFLTDCASIAPTFLSIGNHEGGMSAENRSLLTARQIVLLDNEWIETHGLLLGGLSSPLPYGVHHRTKAPPPPDLSFLVAYAAAPGFHLLLSHHPEFYPAYIRALPVEMTLSGHAHGGQWHLFGRDIFAPGQGLFPKYASGVRENRLVISRGMANTVSFAPRFGNPRELVILHLCPA